MKSPFTTVGFLSPTTVSHDGIIDWSLTLSSDIIAWPERAPVTSSGDLDWAIAFAGAATATPLETSISAN